MDIVRFIQLAQERGLYVYVRFGPYINAEFNLGGVPSWLLKVPGMQFRTDNEQWKNAMSTWVKFIVAKLSDAQLFAPQGGPIILAQIENEYGYQSKHTPGDDAYEQWYMDFALSLGVDIPWTICATPAVHKGILHTANYWDCPSHANTTFNGQPAICTEYWGSWVYHWGEAHPIRPAENVAHSTAKFIAEGGALLVYYTYAGGNNFGRSSGGAYTAGIVTQYDFDGPLDKTNLPSEPKYSHLTELHQTLLANEEVIVSVDNVTRVSLGDTATGYYWGTPGGKCFGMLENAALEAQTITFLGETYTLPAWSFSLLADCKKETYNTALIKNAAHATWQEGMPVQGWSSAQDAVGVWGTPVIASSPLNQLAVTSDETDYLWYVANFTSPVSGQATISIGWGGGDALGGIYVNGKLACEHADGYACTTKVDAGVNTLAILSVVHGLPSFPVGPDTALSLRRGISGAWVNGVQVQGPWAHQAGLQGESVSLAKQTSLRSWAPVSVEGKTAPLTWYRAIADAPAGAAVTLDLLGMQKGIIYVNGHNLGRYWMKTAPASLCAPCDYRGTYDRISKPASALCNDHCGQPSQRHYYVPADWLTPDRRANEIVIFDERGFGSLAEVKFSARLA
eukprot:NODE_100_length_2160_cov_2823.182378_g63_i1.p2 GENE.NODE_100_length_2160_cov_2823.182378_g63_i1~~NODE_100_length_2160_cov_2823.182378_g63_i1.p2  ORF type:complete len:630 (+),score=243.58 NODE_100_length_2160_cov_2823.182378_g63_i1:24-1892(+)